MTLLKTDGQKTQILNDYAAEHLYLFKLISDWQDVAFKPKDDFTALVKARIAEHKEKAESIAAKVQTRMPASQVQTITKKQLDNGMISIAKCDYGYLMERDAKLSALEAAGVDSWAGYFV
ncbi:hypothetical protein RN22_04540 [Grimontia sp. AD028]|uniref:hypothetical protein n=1 Tax=Grimontia sp. AD028 TaxID=1581149 RepID=UPI00061B4F98|nr:hypothetical protein [Grimontia sp. AD028]KKD61629.1 hypothetical protein RN22_04540 [Grimontia sp. AD028]